MLEPEAFIISMIYHQRNPLIAASVPRAISDSAPDQSGPFKARSMGMKPIFNAGELFIKV